jgi:hypothetical protein
MISFLSRSKIDEAKWNDCVLCSAARLPYGLTWYLDSVAEHWDGLVHNDYEAVFPLVWRRRFLIHYLFQPYFTQQLGVFTKQQPHEGLLREMLDAIPARFRFIEINLNYTNRVRHEAFEVSARTNLVLPLDGAYETLADGYHENARRNISKAQKNRLRTRSDLTPETATEFFKANTGVKIPEIGEYVYEHLQRLMRAALQRKMGEVVGVFDENDNLYATGFFATTENRILNLLPSIDDEGKDAGAGFYLVDHVIRKYAGTGRVLDFEGSMIPSIARFYKSFGAQEQTYWRLRRNNLPWVLRWVKE